MVKLLFITQKVDKNDDVLGVYHEWTRAFAEKAKLVLAICLFKGEHDLPNNVKVLSLGKEKGKSRLKYILNFYKYIWRERKNYDSVFVHMNPEYVILGGLFWKLWKKKIGLWYAHGAVNLKLRVAEKIADIIFTSTRSGFRIESKKIRTIGQGIDVNKFSPILQDRKNDKNDMFKIITVGRISPVKDYETLIGAIGVLNKDNVKISADIVGDVGLSCQGKYLEGLKSLIQEKKLGNVINFIGSVPNREIAAKLQQADLFVNMSHTGSLDKAILEAMACGLPVLTCNEALLEVLGDDYKAMLMYPKNDLEELAKKIKFIMNLDKVERKKISEDLREIVVKDHSLKGLIDRIILVYK